MVLLPNFPDKVRFFDTTLRDGEQTPGVSLTPVKKLQIARKLDELGVDTIEAGFAAVSAGEFEAVKMIASEDLKTEICSAARGRKEDIDTAIEAGVDSVNIITPTSDLHIDQKLRKTRAQILDLIGEAVAHAKDHGLVVELSTEDGSRTDRRFLKTALKHAFDVGVDRVSICDTVGILTPEKSYDLFHEMKKEFPDAYLSVHCHDDFGMAVANSLAGLMAGADQVHATVNGIGERAGNAALEEIAVALRVIYGVETRIMMEELYGTSQLVSRLIGIPICPNKAIVGTNAFSHESGIHTHAVIRNPETYEAIIPEMVGAVRGIVPGKHAGSTGLMKSLLDMGIKPSDTEFREILGYVKNLGDKGENVTDADLLSISRNIMKINTILPLDIEEFVVTTGNKITPTSSVKLRLNGDSFIEAATGNGPVDATLNAVSEAINPENRAYLDTYHVDAITGGSDAVVNVEVRLRKGDRVVTSKSVNEDIVMASVDAFVKGMNVILLGEKQLKSVPDLTERGESG